MSADSPIPLGYTRRMISQERLGIADGLLEKGIDEGLFTHAVYMLEQGGQSVAPRTFGAATRQTVFDLASLTKPLATATAILQLVECGCLHLVERASEFFAAEFGPLPHLDDVTIYHLLTHTAGLPPIPCWPDAGATRPERVRALLDTPLIQPPGVEYIYSDTGYLLLGEIVERVSRQTLGDYFAARIAEPLGLAHTGFLPQARENIAPAGKLIPLGAVHDPRARALGGVAGHAGLFGTVDDVLKYAETVRTGGGPILAPVSVARIRRSQVPPELGGQSLGWYCRGNAYLPAGDLFSDRAFGHSGFTGTLILIDPEYDVSLVLLTNRVVNEAEDGTRFLRLRRCWLNAVAASLTQPTAHR